MNSKKPRVFILTSRVYEEAGGRTKATIERILLLRKHFDTTLIEMSSGKYPAKELKAVFSKYKEIFPAINPWQEVRVEPTAHTCNYMDYLRQRTGNLSIEGKIFEGAQEACILSTLSRGKIKVYVNDNKIIRLREFHSDGTVEVFSLDDRQNIVFREVYYEDNLLARYYLNDTGFVSAGFICGEDGNIKNYLYRMRNGDVVYSDTLLEHNVVFLNDVLSDGDVIISDVRYYDDVLDKIKHSVRKIHVWHEIAINQYADSGINPEYKTLTDPVYPLAKNDRIIVFTEDAKKEYSESFPHLKNNFRVIPYGITLKATIDGISRDNNLVISIGRLQSQKQKRVDDQIRAFGLFYTTNPDARLNIFGQGNDTEKLKRLVKELRLDAVVQFSGFAHDVDKEFQRAGMMIFSSSYETFGLTILESLSNGTPVVSYDVRFGAKTMIKDNYNGFISKANTPEALAEAMTRMYNTDLNSLSVRESVQDKFSHENFEKNWLAIIVNGE